MRAVDRTTRLFRATIAEALPGVRTSVDRSSNSYGRSNYVYVYLPRRVLKIRISDHAIGMRRALSGAEDLYIAAGAGPASWAVWLGGIVRQLDR